MITQASAKQAAPSTAQLSTFGFIHFSYFADSRADAAAQKIDHAVIGGVVAVVVFAMLCLLIVLGRYFARHKGTPGTRYCATFAFAFPSTVYLSNCFHIYLSQVPTLPTKPKEQTTQLTLTQPSSMPREGKPTRMTKRNIISNFDSVSVSPCWTRNESSVGFGRKGRGG